MSFSRLIAISSAIIFPFLSFTHASEQEKKPDKKQDSMILRIDDWLGSGGNFMNMTSTEFMAQKNMNIYFKWLSAKKDSVRAPAFIDGPPIGIFDVRVYEVIINFDKDAKVKNMILSLYNRGDAGEVEKNRFDKGLEEIQKRLAAFVGSEPGPERKEIVNSKNIRTRTWVKEPDYQLTLRWSASDERNPSTFRGEYIQLEITKFDPANDPRKKSVHAQAEKVKVAEKDALIGNLKHEENGDVFLDNIPMVDQGAKGYCAVASSERVLRFYGLNVDQHMLAQLVDATSAGTDPAAMTKALKQVGGKYKVIFKILYDDKNFDTIPNFAKFMNMYNSTALKEKKKTMDPGLYKQQVGNTIMWDPVRALMDMDPEVFVKCRTERESGDYKRFIYDVKENINNGIPVMWALTLGIVKEPKLPQRFGGHMRLIIGYNDKTKEIIYSDSWGNGHEFKKMSMEKAWAITRMTCIFLPSRRGI